MSNDNVKKIKSEIIDVLWGIDERSRPADNRSIEFILPIDKEDFIYVMNDFYKRYEIDKIKKTGVIICILDTIFFYGEDKFEKWLKPLCNIESEKIVSDIIEAINTSSESLIIELIKNLRNAEDEERYKRRIINKRELKQRRNRTVDMWTWSTIINMREHEIKEKEESK